MYYDKSIKILTVCEALAHKTRQFVYYRKDK